MWAGLHLPITDRYSRSSGLEITKLSKYINTYRKMKTFKMLRTAAITGYIVLAVVLFSSCETDKGKEQFDKRYWELKTATMELEYLEKLYKVREDISFREKIRVLDSIYMDWKLKSCGLDSLNNR